MKISKIIFFMLNQMRFEKGLFLNITFRKFHCFSKRKQK